MRSMYDATCTIKTRKFFEQFGEIIEFLQTSFQEGRTAHQVEEGLWRRVLELGRHAFGAWLALFGAGDEGEHVLLEEDPKLRRLEVLHRREYRNVFGLFERFVGGVHHLSHPA